MNKNDIETLCNLPIRNHSSEVSKYFMIGLVYQNRTTTFAHRIFDSLQSVGIPLKFFSYHCVNSDVLIWENWGIFFCTESKPQSRSRRTRVMNLHSPNDLHLTNEKLSMLRAIYMYAKIH